MALVHHHTIESDPEYQNLKQNHKDFIANVLAGKNYTDSYHLVYPNASRRTSGTKGCGLYNKYKNLIDRHQAVTPQTLSAIANETVANLKAIAFSDPSKIVDSEGKIVPMHRLPQEIKLGITEVSIKGDVVKYKMDGKLKAMELLARICKLDEGSQTTVNIAISESERENKIKEILVRALGREEEK